MKASVTLEHDETSLSFEIAPVAKFLFKFFFEYWFETFLPWYRKR